MTDDDRKRGMQILWNFEYLTPGVYSLRKAGFSIEEIVELSGETLEIVQKCLGCFEPPSPFPDDTEEQLLKIILSR